jgi:hypothetical protein
MMHNCPPFFVIPLGMGSGCNIICGIISCCQTGEKEDNCECERVHVNRALFASVVQVRGSTSVGGFTTIDGAGGTGCKFSCRVLGM